MNESKNYKSDPAEDEKELVNEIRAVGYEIDSVYDFVNNKPHPTLGNNFTDTYEKAYPILVEHLKKPHHPRIREGIVRALTEKDAAAIAKEPLLEAFHNEKNKFVKWAIANALKYLMSKPERDRHPEIDKVLSNINAV